MLISAAGCSKTSQKDPTPTVRVGPTDFRERTDDRDPKTAPICVATDQGGGEGGAAQLAISGYHTRLIHFIQCFMKISTFLVPEG